MIAEIITFAVVGVLLLGKGPVLFKKYAQTRAQLFGSDIFVFTRAKTSVVHIVSLQKRILVAERYFVSLCYEF